MFCDEINVTLASEFGLDFGANASVGRAFISSSEDMGRIHLFRI